MKVKTKPSYPSAKNPIVVNRSLISVSKVLAKLIQVTSGKLLARREAKTTKYQLCPFVFWVRWVTSELVIIRGALSVWLSLARLCDILSSKIATMPAFEVCPKKKPCAGIA